MFTVHKIEIDNIRSIGHAVFEPLVDGGITAVNGPNGVGKSTILSAMIWCVFGVTPDGVSRSAMRRQNSDDICRVIVTFEHDTQIVTVERGLKGRKDATYMRVEVNGVEQAVGKIGAAESFITNLLGGLTAEGFLTAFVIRQKELDGLVKAKPSERRKLIERLAGIDRMSLAVKTSREEENDTKKRIELLPGSREDLETAREQLAEAENHATLMWETHATTEKNTEKQQAVVEETHQKVETITNQTNAYRDAAQKTTNVRHQLEIAQNTLNNLEENYRETKLKSQNGSPEQLQAAEEKVQETTRLIQKNKEERSLADQYIKEAETAKSYADRTQTRYDNTTKYKNQIEEETQKIQFLLQDYPFDLPEQIEDAEQNLTEITEQVGALRNEYDKITASLKAMNNPNLGKHCPTCDTALADPTTVINALTEARQKITTKGKTAGENQNQLQQKLLELKEQNEKRTQYNINYQQLSEQLVHQEQLTKTAAKENNDAQNVAIQATTKADQAKEQAYHAATQTNILNRQAVEATEHLRKTQLAADALENLIKIGTQIENTRQNINHIQEQLEILETEEQSLYIDPEEQSRISQIYEQNRTNLNQLRQEQSSAFTQLKIAEEQYKQAEKNKDAEELKVRARSEAYTLLEKQTAVREALDLFRKDRIASLAPELSEIATDQISRMTDGKFVSVELDEEFTPVITDQKGNQRPAAWLSGGEESAVALSLRLAIGEVIAGNKGGLLWMDEPQTAMDASRRPAMMSVIRDLPGRQPIIISHVTEATDMVDQVIEVIPDEENGSIIQTDRETINQFESLTPETIETLEQEM